MHKVCYFLSREQRLQKIADQNLLNKDLSGNALLTCFIFCFDDYVSILTFVVLAASKSVLILTRQRYDIVLENVLFSI